MSAASKLTRVNPAGPAPTTEEFRRHQDFVERALIQAAAQSTLNWISVEQAKLFNGSWKNNGNGAELASFAIDQSRRVFLRGSVYYAGNYIAGSFPKPNFVFALPSANAPVYDRYYPVDVAGSYGSVLIYGRFGSAPTKAGQIWLQTAGADPSRVTLDGISFEASS